MAALNDIASWTLAGVDWSNPRGTPAEVEMLRQAIFERRDFLAITPVSGNYPTQQTRDSNLRWPLAEASAVEVAHARPFVGLQNTLSNFDHVFGTSPLAVGFVDPEWNGGKQRPQNIATLYDLASLANVAYQWQGSSLNPSMRGTRLGENTEASSRALAIKAMLGTLRVINEGRPRVAGTWYKRGRTPVSMSFADSLAHFKDVATWQYFPAWGKNSHDAYHFCTEDSTWRDIYRQGLAICSDAAPRRDPRCYSADAVHKAFFMFYDLGDDGENNDFEADNGGFVYVGAVPPLPNITTSGFYEPEVYDPDNCIHFGKIDHATVTGPNRGWRTYPITYNWSGQYYEVHYSNPFVLADYSGAYAFP